MNKKRILIAYDRLIEQIKNVQDKIVKKENRFFELDQQIKQWEQIIKLNKNDVNQAKEQLAKINKEFINIAVDDIFKDLRCFIKKNIDVPIKYSFNGLRSDIFYSYKTKYNGSQPETLRRIKNVVMFQYIANKDEFIDFNLEETKIILLLYAAKYWVNVNDNITYNEMGNKIYSPLMKNVENNDEYIPMLFKDLKNGAEFLFNIDKQEYIVLKDIKNNEKILNIKANNEYHMRKLNKEEVINLIKEVEQKLGRKPCLKDVYNYYNEKIEDIEDYDEYMNKKISKECLRNYITRDGLDNLIIVGKKQ